MGACQRNAAHETAHLPLQLEFYLFDRQLHNIREIISKCERFCQETLIKAVIGR